MITLQSNGIEANGIIIPFFYFRRDCQKKLKTVVLWCKKMDGGGVRPESNGAEN